VHAIASCRGCRKNHGSADSLTRALTLHARYAPAARHAGLPLRQLRRAARRRRRRRRHGRRRNLRGACAHICTHTHV
jgi:hypothetical protein